MTSRRSPYPAGEAGSAVMLGGSGLVLAVMLALVTLDATAYLLAASRAQAAADAAALAAATAVDAGRPGELDAREVVEAAAAELVACICRRAQVTVRVGVDVEAILVTRLAPRRVVATAHATVVDAPYPRLPPGHTEPSPASVVVPGSRAGRPSPAPTR